MPIDSPIEALVTWTFKLAVLALHLVEIVFFLGIVGCASVVVISWVSIFSEGFSKDQ